MIADWHFYAFAVPAVLLFGLSKSGLGASLGTMTIPIMSLAVAPVQAAAILLPIIIAMDGFALYAYRHDFDRRTLAILLPAAIAGIAIGWVMATRVSDDAVRLMLGLMAVGFSLRHFVGRGTAREPAAHNRLKAWACGAVSGFTSFIAHSGGVPFQLYALPLRLAPAVLSGTSAVYFAVVNLVKLLPYGALGQFSHENLMTALVLAPLAPISILTGVWLVRRIPHGPFYTLTYACLLLIGLKLTHDGLYALF